MGISVHRLIPIENALGQIGDILGGIGGFVGLCGFPIGNVVDAAELRCLSR